MASLSLRAGWLAASIALCLPAAAQAAGAYVRTGVGYERSSEAGFRDVDCSAPNPLFGCGAAVDGQPLTARGDFGGTAAFDVGLGYRAAPFLRLETLATYRPGLAFSGRSNFPGLGGEQPVSANLDSLSALAVAYADLGSLGRLRPFVGLGGGIARNRLSAVRVFRPIRGGTRTEGAWLATVGMGWSLSDRATLDLAYRYVDLGDVRTGGSGPAPIRAGVIVQGVATSVRWRF